MTIKYIIPLLLIATVITAQTHYADQVTVEWDAPTTYDNGDPIPAGLILTYDVYIREKGGSQVFVGETMTLEYTVTLPAPGMKYDIGVLAKYPVDSDWIYSVVAWSIEEGWDVGFFVPAAQPDNLRVQ